VVHENETIPTLAGDKLLGYHQQVVPTLLEHIRGQTFVTGAHPS
jgi:hypothetical protein